MARREFRFGDLKVYFSITKPTLQRLEKVIKWIKWFGEDEKAGLELGLIEVAVEKEEGRYLNILCKFRVCETNQSQVKIKEE